MLHYLKFPYPPGAQLKILFIGLLLSMIAGHAVSQNVVNIDDKVPQHMFSYGEIESLPDPNNTITFADVLKPEFAAKFKKSTTFTPKYYNIKSYFWYRFRIRES